MTTSEAALLQSLENVLTRLALTPEEQLEKVYLRAEDSPRRRKREVLFAQVLWKLFPAVIRQLKEPSQAVLNKVVTVLSHANHRLDANEALQLPLVDLTELFVEADAQRQSRVLSFALIYIEKAFSRSSVDAQVQVFPDLMKGVGRRPPDQRTVLLRCCMIALEGFASSRSSESAKKPKLSETSSMFTFLENEADRNAFLEFASWTLLFQTRAAAPSQLSVFQGGQLVPMAPELAHRLTGVPPGLSPEIVTKVKGNLMMTEERLSRRKIGLLNFLKETDLKAQLFLPFLIASTDSAESVNREGELSLKKHFRIEMDSKDIDLDDPELIKSVLELFQGSRSRGVAPTAETVSTFRVPASPTLQSKLLEVLVKSTEAANRFPENTQVPFYYSLTKLAHWVSDADHLELCIWKRHTHELASAGHGILSLDCQARQARHTPTTCRAHARGLPHTFKMRNEHLYHQQKLLELMRNSKDLVQKGYVYDAIAQLARRCPSIFQDRIEAAKELFMALEREPAGVRSQAQTAVSMLASAYSTSDAATVEAVRQLLLESICSESSVVRLVAVTWSMRLFPFEDCLARYVCIVGAADEQREVHSEARLGLEAVTFSRETSTHAAASYPTIPQFLLFLRERNTQIRAGLRKSDAVAEVLMKFLRKCQMAHAEEEVLDDSSLEGLLRVYEHPLAQSPSTDLVITVFEAVVDLLQSKREGVGLWSGERLLMLRQWIFHTSNAVRIPCAQLIAAGVTALEPSRTAWLIQEIHDILSGASEQKAKFETKCGSIQLLGYMSSFCQSAEMLARLVEMTMIMHENILKSGDPHLQSMAALCFGHQVLNPAFVESLKHHFSSQDLTEESDSWLSELLSSGILLLCNHSNMAVALRAVLATGLVCKGLDDAELEEKCLMHLVSMQNIKQEELQYAVGEALALGIAKTSIPSDKIVAANYTYLRKMQTDFSSLPPAVSRSAMHGRVLDALLKGLMHTRRENRSACVSHLVTIMTFCPRNRSVLQRLEEAQLAFLNLLGDKDDLVQEMAPRGISIVYNLGDADAKSKLLSNLTSVLKDPSKQGKAVKVDADTEIFEEGELGKAPGGESLTTYKELSALATDMGKPDLLYKFMDLANHQAALNSRRGAAAGFAHIAELAGEDLKPYLSAILPRVYRLQFDPNPVVQETMQNICKSLLTDKGTKLSDYLNLILRDLLTEIGSRLWRHREASCRALAAILQGRQWTELRDSFDQLWRMAFRAADDIKESVRVAGVQLLKSLKRITLKFTNAHSSDSVTVAEAVSRTLPILLETVTHSSVASNVRVAFSVLSEITSTCPAQQMRPHLALLVPVLLQSLSSTESGILDELQLNVMGAGIDPEELEKARVRVASQSPIQNILNRCIQMVDVATLDEHGFASKLKELIRTGVGLNTRVATVHFVKQLAANLGSEFGPQASRMLDVLLSKSLSDGSSTTLKKASASTIGALCKVSSSKAVGKLVDTCLTSIKKSEGDHQMVGLIFKELHSQAPGRFSDHAPNIIPLAYVSHFDSGSEAGATWSSVLDECMVTESGTIRLHRVEIVRQINESLEDHRWTMRGAACKAIERMYEVDRDIMQQHSELFVGRLLEQLPGRLWTGKEAIFKALAKICTSTPTVVSEYVIRVGDAMNEACMKDKKEYRETALECLAEILLHCKERGVLYERVVSFLVSNAVEVSPAKGDSNKDDSGSRLPFKRLMQALGHGRSGLSIDQLTNSHDSDIFGLFESNLNSPQPRNPKGSLLQSLILFLKDSTFSMDQLEAQFDKLISGVSSCLEEQKYEQFRLEALDAAEAIRESAVRHRLGDVVARLKAILLARAETETSLVVKQKQLSILENCN